MFLQKVNYWTFAKMSFELQLVLEELITVTNDVSVGNEDRRMAEKALDDFSLALLNKSLSPGFTNLLPELLKGVDSVVMTKVSGFRQDLKQWLIVFQILLNGVRKLTECFDATSGSTIDEAAASMESAKDVLRRLVTFRASGVTADLTDPLVRAALLHGFTARLEALRPFRNLNISTVGPEGIYSLGDTLGFLLRVLHFYFELWGTNLDGKEPAVVSTLTEFAVVRFL